MKRLVVIDIIGKSLEHYDSRKGFLRRIFGDSKPITQLRAFRLQLIAQNKEQRHDSLNPTEEMTLLNILSSGLNNRRLTGDITRTLFSALNKRLINTVKTLEEYKVPLPNLIKLLPNKKNLDKIFNILKAKSLLSDDIIAKILLHTEHSKCLAFLIEKTPQLTKTQLNKLIDSDWFYNREIKALLFTNVLIEQERILELIELNDVNQILAELKSDKEANKIPIVRAGRGVMYKHINWASHQKTPSCFNLCNFFKASPTLPDETQHLLEWIKMPG